MKPGFNQRVPRTNLIPELAADGIDVDHNGCSDRRPVLPGRESRLTGYSRKPLGRAGDCHTPILEPRIREDSQFKRVVFHDSADGFQACRDVSSAS